MCMAGSVVFYLFTFRVSARAGQSSFHCYNHTVRQRAQVSEDNKRHLCTHKQNLDPPGNSVNWYFLNMGITPARLKINKERKGKSCWCIEYQE